MVVLRLNYIIILFSIVCILLLLLYSDFANEHISSKVESNDRRYEKYASVKYPDIEQIENGDIVFRSGYGVDSTVAAHFSEGEKRYSHAGIAYKEGKDVYVIHSEEDEEGHNGVFKERLESFLDNSPIWAIYRYRLDEKSRKEIVAKAIKYLSKKIKFDNDFDLKDDRKMYCTEFIYKVVNRTLNKEIIHAVVGKPTW
jgi:hypothetical protein